MKKKTTLFSIFLMLFMNYSVVSATENTAKRTVFIIQQTDSPFKHLYDKKLHIAHHTKGKIKVGHKGTDYVLFSADGKYTQNWSGIESTGTWRYNAADNSILVVLKNQNTWLIKEVKNDRLQLTQGNEYISLFLPDSSK